MADARLAWSLKGRLLALLLAFGVVPLAVVASVGYTVSRRLVTAQAERAVAEVTAQEAVHVATELDRERLLLRTIAGQLPENGGVARMSPGELGRLLLGGLPEGGVFDGLRVVARGRVLAAVALRDLRPHWPSTAPAADWTRARVAVHRAGATVIAYLLAVPVSPASSAVWLEGHVRAEDFRRLLGLPAHPTAGLELAVMDPHGLLVSLGPSEASAGLTAAFADWRSDSLAVRRIRLGDTTALGAAARVGGQGTDWVVVASLPAAVALAPLYRLRDAALLGLVVLIAVIVATGVLASGPVTGPLRELTRAASRFGSAGVRERVPASGPAEVVELVRTFNRMAEDLERSRGEIQRLHQADLERAQQLATVGELASGVAHEIRNPLTGVRGAMDLALRRMTAQDPSRPLLDEAQRQLERIENTITQLLRYARPPEVKEIRVDANDLAARALQVVGPHAARGDVRLVVEPSPAPTRVRADPELMVQVLVNLLLNAVEVTPRGGLVTLWLARHAPEAWLGVRDAGPGVAPELRERVFRPFFTTKGHGTGLGLSISRQIVERHRGSLRIEDTPGGGATFVVALPLAEGGGTGDETLCQAPPVQAA